MSKKSQWDRSLPLTIAFGVVCLTAQPIEAIAQTAGGRPSVEVDNSVLDQLGPPGNLPAMLLQTTPSPAQRPLVLIAPKSAHHLDRPNRSSGKDKSAKNLEPAAIHLHPIKPHAGPAALKDSGPAALKPEGSAPRPTSEGTPTKAARGTIAADSKPATPFSLTPTLSPAPTMVTTEPLKPPPPNRDQAAVAAPLPSATPANPAAVPPSLALTAQSPNNDAASGTAAPQESLSTVRFDKESAILPDSSRDLLAHLASRMSEDPTLEVQLLAYAAGDEANSSKARRLSLSRALAVRSFLNDLGVRNTRIEMRARGNKVPDGEPDRVDIVMLKRG